MLLVHLLISIAISKHHSGYVSKEKTNDVHCHKALAAFLMCVTPEGSASICISLLFENSACLFYYYDIICNYWDSGRGALFGRPSSSQPCEAYWVLC